MGAPVPELSSHRIVVLLVTSILEETWSTWRTQRGVRSFSRVADALTFGQHDCVQGRTLKDDECLEGQTL